MKFYSIFIQGLKYFILQTLMEVIIIIVLLYLGIPYFEMKVGNESFYKMVIGVLGYYALIKCIYYGWIYLIAFTGIGFIWRLKTRFAYSLLNAILSITYIMLFLINGKQFSWVLNPLLACIAASSIIIIIFRINRMSQKSKTAS